MHAATDEAIFERAALESRVVGSADTDFGTLPALREATSPSVILLRAASLRRADDQVALILVALPSTDAALLRGAIVILERHRRRLRDLPITRRRMRIRSRPTVPAGQIRGSRAKTSLRSHAERQPDPPADIG
jgi:predicted nuclease of predicted toxin-antitoxin system